MKPLIRHLAFMMVVFTLISTMAMANIMLPLDHLKVSPKSAHPSRAATTRLAVPAPQLLDGRILLPGPTRPTDNPKIRSEVMLQSGIRFTENRGQIVDSDGRVRNDIAFIADAPGAKLFFRNDGISYVFTEQKPRDEQADQEFDAVMSIAPQGQQVRSHRLDMFLDGSNPHVRIRAEGQLPGYSNYYQPHCPNGITGIHDYSRIVYENVYDDIDLEIFSSQGRMKYNFVVRPGGSPNGIRMRYEGAMEAELTNEGALFVSTPLGRVEEDAPHTYCGDKDNAVASEFMRNGNTVSFSVGEYDPSQTLVIDPWATYYGGSGDDAAEGVCMDAGGNVVVSGTTTSTNFPVLGGHQSSNAGGKDAFVVKFDAYGTRLWTTYFGGSIDENGPKVAAGSNGMIAVAGHTTSADLPVTGGAFQIAYAGNGDVFLAQFDANGARVWATYYGGSKAENFPCMSTDSNGGILFAGSTTSRNFPVSPGAYQTSPSWGYLGKMNANGSRAWATFFGDGHAWGIAADANNNVLATGFTSSASYPVTPGAAQGALAGSTDAFLVKFTENGARIWASYHGGSDSDWGRGICANANGDIFITGYTKSLDFPVTSTAFQTSYAGGTMDAFISAFTASGTVLWKLAGLRHAF